MLWPVLKPEQSGLYWLDDVHKNFYECLFKELAFDECFVEDFQPVLDASNRTRELFQSVCDEYIALEPSAKNSFQVLYQSHLGYQSYFSDTSTNILKPALEHEDLWKASKKLGGYLYSTTIGLTCFSNASGDSPSMAKHFEEFKTLNGTVCCFCGTEEMMEERELTPEDGVTEDEERQWRASYDHYLPKKHYPFIAVDFHNLVPCCHICNEKAKGEKDVLEKNGRRRLAFNPYQDANGVKLAATYNLDGFKNLMSVAIEHTGCELQDKANVWDDVFLIMSRVNQRLKRFDESWLAPVLNGCEGSASARSVLEGEVSRCREVKHIERDAHLKSLCFSDVLQKTDDQIADLMIAVEQVYSPRAII